MARMNLKSKNSDPRVSMNHNTKKILLPFYINSLHRLQCSSSPSRQLLDKRYGSVWLISV